MDSSMFIVLLSSFVRVDRPTKNSVLPQSQTICPPIFISFWQLDGEGKNGKLTFGTTRVHKWYHKLKADCPSIVHTKQSGRLVTAFTVELQNKIYALIQSDRKMHLSDIVDTLNVYFGTVQSTVTNKLKYWNICAPWTAHLLNSGQLAAHWNVCRESHVVFEREQRYGVTAN